MNGTLVTIKTKETLSMIQNMEVPCIKAEGSKDENLHAFEIEMGARKHGIEKIGTFKAARTAAKYFLKITFFSNMILSLGILKG